MISRYLCHLRLSAMQDLTMLRFLYRENYQKCNESLACYAVKIMREFLTLWHDEYNFMSHRQSLEISWDKSNETSQL